MPSPPKAMGVSGSSSRQAFARSDTSPPVGGLGSVGPAVSAGSSRTGSSACGVRSSGGESTSPGLSSGTCAGIISAAGAALGAMALAATRSAPGEPASWPASAGMATASAGSVPGTAVGSPGRQSRSPGQITSASTSRWLPSGLVAPWFRSNRSDQRAWSPSSRAAIADRVSPGWTVYQRSPSTSSTSGIASGTASSQPG